MASSDSGAAVADASAVFESDPAASTASAGTATAPNGEEAPTVHGSRPADPEWKPRKQAARRSINELNSWMAQMRDRCDVVESSPEAAVADVRRSAAEDDEQPQEQKYGRPATAPKGPATTFSPPTRSRAETQEIVRMQGKTNAELSDWMSKIREKCVVLESMPTATTADAQSEKGAQAATTAPRPLQQLPRTDDKAITSGTIVSPRPRSPRPLSPRPKEALRNVDEGLTSDPSDPSAGGATLGTAVANADSSAKETVRADAEPAASDTAVAQTDTNKSASDVATAGKIGKEFLDQNCEAGASGPATDPAAAELALLRESVQAGGSLPHSSRNKLWSAYLVLDDASQHVNAPEALIGLLGGDSENEDVLFDVAGEAPSKPDQLRLAKAFSEKYLSFINLRRTAIDVGHLFAALAQLIRYHSPQVACMIEAASTPLGLDLSSALRMAVFGGFKRDCEDGGAAEELQSLIFTVRGSSDTEALLQFCDLVVVEEEDLLLLFLVAMRLMQLALEPHPSMDSLKQELRSAMMLRGLHGVSTAVADAMTLVEATPVTVISLLSGGHVGPLANLPMCMVTADEILHHVYEKPSRPWRLVVVDARMTSDGQRLVLPVCVQLARGTHKHRRQILREMPFEESIHLCLMGDNPPRPGDDAFELCRHLQSSTVQRRHVSVVYGGWPAVENLAECLKLDLMRAESEESESKGSGSLKEDFKIVAGASREAAADAAKVAQRMWAGAGRWFGALGEKPASPSGSQRPGDVAAAHEGS